MVDVVQKAFFAARRPVSRIESGAFEGGSKAEPKAMFGVRMLWDGRMLI